MSRHIKIDTWMSTKERDEKDQKTYYKSKKDKKSKLKSIWLPAMSSRKWWWCKAKNNDILFFSFAKYKRAQRLLSLILN